MIRFENVHKHYGTVHALQGVDIHVEEGQFTILIGPSGCGKTTALKMVNRLITPTRGRVLVGDEDVANQNAVELRRRIGYVIQETGLFPHMTIADNIALVPKLKKWPQARRNDRVDELLHLVGLDPAEYRNRYPRHLSGGQRQRVGVARALAGDPPIILMDEPFGATDPITRKQLQNELVRIKQQVKKTIVFVTHDISEAFLLGDSICLLKDGQVIQHATPEQLLRQPANEFVSQFVGDEAIVHQFDYLKVGEISDTPVVTVTETTPAQVVMQNMQDGACEAALVVNDAGQLQGVITEQTFEERQTEGTHHLAKDLAVPNPPSVFQDELVRECFPRLIQQNEAYGRRNGEQASMVPSDLLVVVDDRNKPKGLITYRDLVRLIAHVAGKELNSEPHPVPSNREVSA